MKSIPALHEGDIVEWKELFIRDTHSLKSSGYVENGLVVFNRDGYGRDIYYNYINNPTFRVVSRADGTPVFNYGDKIERERMLFDDVYKDGSDVVGVCGDVVFITHRFSSRVTSHTQQNLYAQGFKIVSDFSVNKVKNPLSSESKNGNALNIKRTYDVHGKPSEEDLDNEKVDLPQNPFPVCFKL